jgi:Siphovirus ReqiPepy6 Gp37-like protein
MMDVFRFTNPTAPTLMQQGLVINGLKSKMWIERYAPAGEFTFVAPATTAMRNSLPIGSFVSHLDTSEIMIVENHEIVDQKDQDSDLVITGRGLETFFENRIVGSNKAYPTSGVSMEYALAAALSWDQIVTLLQAHLTTAILIDDNDAFPYLNIVSQVTGSGTNVARALKRGDLYTHLQDLLAVDDLGVRIFRPGVWPALPGGGTNTTLALHKGVDRSGSIIFSHDTGEIESAGYLWSNKKLKNTALVTGRWVETLVTTTATEYNRRMMVIEASDIDNQYTVAPAGADLTAVVAAMQQRGAAYLAAQNDIALTRAEVSKNASKAVYRKNFDVGDLITVSGDYNANAKMRVSEYVEIEDENGKSSYPTLTML